MQPPAAVLSWPGKHDATAGRAAGHEPRSQGGTGSGKGLSTLLSSSLTAGRAVQGMTVDLAKVSLANMFAEGQAYVALSRARCIPGLQITGFSPDCAKVAAILLLQTAHSHKHSTACRANALTEASSMT